MNIFFEDLHILKIFRCQLCIPVYVSALICLSDCLKELYFLALEISYHLTLHDLNFCFCYAHGKNSNLDIAEFSDLLYFAQPEETFTL